MAKEAKDAAEKPEKPAPKPPVRITQRYRIYLPGGGTCPIEAENREDAEGQARRILSRNIAPVAADLDD